MTRRIPKDLKPGVIFTVDRGLWVRKRADGTLIWGISYQHRGKLRRRAVGPSKTLARAALDTVRADIARNTYQLDQRRHIPPEFDTFADTYLEHARQHKRSWQRDELAIEAARPLFHGKRLDEVVAFDLERFKAARREKATASSVNRDLSVLRRLFALAVEWGEIATNPARTVRPFKVDETPLRVLTQDEETKLYRACAHHLQPLIALALNTGMRRGELLALRWEDVDRVERVVTIRHSKSGRVRHIPLNDVAMDALRLVGFGEGLVFRYRGGGIQSVKTGFRGAVERSGIAPCRFHDLRHTFASRLVAAGVDLPTVQEILGHASIVTTRKYVHPAPAHKKAAVLRLQLRHYVHDANADQS